ncbi:MAG: cadherin domain-containing protein [Microcystis sp. LE19-388.1G]|nr:cadherin domain-containing protein [Microcystis sp. LE19-388.1G]
MIQYYGDITGNLWNDFDGNGELNSGYHNSQEPGFVGWTITLTKPSDPSFSKVTYAESSGDYSFGSLPLGDYLITVTLPSQDWVRTTNYHYNNSTNTSQPVSLSAQYYYGVHGIDARAPFSYRKPETQITGYLWNYLWNDANANSNGYWLVYLDTNNNGILDTNEKRTFTDGSGYYTFTGLEGNTNYTVSVVKQSDSWQTTTGYGDTQIISTTTGEISQANFAYRLSDGQIQGSLWNDANSDAIQDQSESLLAGWTVNLLQNGTLISSTVTDNGGRYVFVGVSPGDYSVEVIPLDANWQFTNSPGFPVSVSASQLIDNVSFGLSNPNNTGITGTYGEISGAVWNDADGDNYLDEYDPTSTYYYYYDPNFGLAGWTVFLDSDNSGTLDAGETSTKTDPWGRYNFAGLASGDYNVTVIVPPTVQSWQSTGSGNYNSFPSDSRLVTVASGASLSNIDFGYKQNVSLNYGDITGYVWNDFSGDGVFDNSYYSDDKGLAGWKVSLEDENGQTVQTTLTNTYGYYGFTGVSSFNTNSYNVTVESPDGLNIWQSTYSPSQPIVYSGSSISDINFGYQSTYRDISGFIWNDVNGNGTWYSEGQEANEGNLPHWKINLIQNGQIIDSTYTNSTGTYYGWYSFGSRPFGDYTVSVELPSADWQPTKGNNSVGATSVSFTTSAQNPWGSSYNQFGFQGTKGEIIGFLWNDIDKSGSWGYAFTGNNYQFEPALNGWTVYLDQNNNNVRDPGETNTVTDNLGGYEFKDLVAGTYRVKVDTPAGWQFTFPTPPEKVLTITTSEIFSRVNFGYVEGSGNRPPQIQNRLWGRSIVNNVTIPGVYVDPDGNALTGTATKADGTSLPPWLTLTVQSNGDLTLNSNNPPRYFVPFDVKIAVTDGQASIDHIFRIYPSYSGFVIDNYVAGATVFFDANKDGVLDTNEPFTTTDQTGFYLLDIPQSFDTNGNGVFDPEEGRLVVFGGVDTATGLPLQTPLTALAGSTTITALTSLVENLVSQGLTVEQANTAVTTALSLPAGVDLSNIDPIVATTNNTPGGAATFAALVQVQNAITQIAGLLDGASSASTGDIVKNVVSALASQIQGGTPVDLTDATKLQTVIQEAATLTNVDVSAIATGAAQVIAAANQKIEDIAASTPNASLQEKFAQVQKVALGETTNDLQQAGAGTKSITAVVTENTGTALTNQINNAQVLSQAPTDVSLNTSSVAENLPIGTEVGTFSTVDPDSSEPFTYSLIGGTGSTDNSLFQISGNRLLTNAIFDYESKNSYSIRVQTSDSNGGVFQKALTINVNDVNENENPTDLSLSNNSVEENSPLNTLIGNFTTTDPDTGNTFSYSLVTGIGSTDNSLFTISGNQLKTNAIFDYETKNSYSIRVKTTDQGGLSFEKTLTITVNDVNETPSNQAPTDLALSATTVNENVPVNTVIGTFSTTDPDTGNTFTYSLVAGTGDTDNSEFSIVGNQLQINNSPDFETKNSYSIRVKTTDQGGLSFEKTLTITVNDVNETPSNQAPTNLVLSATTVNENVAPNTVIGTFSSTDPDTGNSFIYSLVTGTGDTDNSAFSIVGNQLQINNSPDFETKNSYSIRVKTTDQGGLSFEKTLTITVNDVNETPSNQAPTALIFQNAVTELAENVDVTPEFKVADLLIEDDGLGTNNLFLTGRDKERFLIQNSALFYVGFTPNFEAQNSYEVTVNVDDPTVGVTPDLTQTLTLNITDVNEAPTALIVANSTNAIAENTDTSQGVKVADIQISDDALGTNSLSLLGNDQSSFQIRGRELFFIGKADFEAQSLYNLTVAVTDTTLNPAPNATPDATVNFTLGITNLPDQTLNPQTIQFNNTADGQGSLVFNFSNLPGSIQVKAIEEGLRQTGAFFNNVVGLYPVADDNGAVFDSLDLDGDGNVTELIQPGQAGYARTALSQAVNNFILQASGEGANQSTTAAEFGDVLLEGGRRYAPFVIANGGNLGESLQGSIQAFLTKNPDNVAATLENYISHEVAYFSFGAANPDGAEHLRSRGNNIFGFEDLPGNLPNISDNDFNDGILAFNFIA